MYHYAGNNPIKYTDPDGRAPYPKYGGPDINLFPTWDDLYQTSRTQKHMSDVFVVAGHGNITSMFRYEKDAAGNIIKIPIPAEELVAMIKASPNYQEGMVIELWACSTGASTEEFESYAQKVADGIGEGVIVRAPNSVLWIRRGNIRIIFAKKIIIVDGKEVEVEDRTKPGQWVEFTGRKKEESSNENQETNKNITNEQVNE